MSEQIKNHYEPKSVMRTFAGVASSLLFMGVPVGVVEFLRPNGVTLAWQLGFAATALAIVLAIVSIRGTLKD